MGFKGMLFRLDMKVSELSVNCSCSHKSRKLMLDSKNHSSVSKDFRKEQGDRELMEVSVETTKLLTD